MELDFSKKPDDIDNLSEDEQTLEFEKCASSFKYFAETYVRITHPKKGLVNFKLYGYQERVIDEYNTFKHNIIRKFRQGGLTTLTVIWCAWRCMFKLDQKIMVLSKSDREARGAGKIVTNMIKYLPDWIKPAVELDNQHEKVFAHTGGSIEFWTCEAARSKSLTYLIIDEAAFIKGMDEHWKSMYPTLATGGSCIVISTVNGMGNWYEQWYHDAESERNEFHVIDIHYTENPDYNNDQWVREMRANLGERGWNQEILGVFFGSGDTYIPGEAILKLEEKTRLNHPVRKLFQEWEGESQTADYLMINSKYEKGALWVWKEPEKNREYMLAADPSEGVNADFSAFHVFDVGSMEQVAEFHSDIVPSDKFAQVVYNVGMWYNNALVAVETCGPSGGAVIDRLENLLHYDNLYYPQTGRNDRAGVRTDKVNRPLFLEAFRTAILNEEIIINSSRIVKEMKTFLYNKLRKRAEADRGKHDDLIMSLAMLLGVKTSFSRHIPIGAESLVKTVDATRQESFLKIKAEIEGSLIEELLAQMEEEIDPSDAKLIEKNIFNIQRKHDAILREFGW